MRYNFSIARFCFSVKYFANIIRIYIDTRRLL